MFELIDYKVKISPAMLNVPEYKAIWERDKVKGKHKSFAELSYVYYVSDYKSAYINYPEEDRLEVVARDHCYRILGDKWSPDNKVKEAILKYRELQTTPSLRYLQSVEQQLDKIVRFFNGVQIDEDTIKTIVDSTDKANKIILSLPKIREAVKKEMSENSKIRGGGNIGMFED